MVMLAGHCLAGWRLRNEVVSRSDSEIVAVEKSVLEGGKNDVVLR